MLAEVVCDVGKVGAWKNTGARVKIWRHWMWARNGAQALCDDKAQEVVEERLQHRTHILSSSETGRLQATAFSLALRDGQSQDSKGLS